MIGRQFLKLGPPTVTGLPVRLVRVNYISLIRQGSTQRRPPRRLPRLTMTQSKKRRHPITGARIIINVTVRITRRPRRLPYLNSKRVKHSIGGKRPTELGTTSNSTFTHDPIRRVITIIRLRGNITITRLWGPVGQPELTVCPRQTTAV